MSVKIINEYGTVHIDTHVIAAIASRTAMEAYGIVGLAYLNMRDGLLEILKKKDSNLSKGVRITVDEGDVITIDLSVILEYGASISVVAQNIMDTVKFNVENLTGLPVGQVNIVVQDIRSDDSEAWG